ncbi:RNA 2',3'-cyclic phosphodiesterase [Chimaeribacter arupi]|uniref:RNA 2',3'-cyclic phosphodiesterase n=1 Tax=Chimaeribacter arupi TaxID=2060066 RepID=UPI0026D0F365
MPDSRRLFFGLPLPDALQQAVIAWRATAFPAEAGRPVAAANLHLTLAFLGEVSDRKAEVLAALAGNIVQPGFPLTLDDLGHWPRPGVVWLGTRRAPRGLLQLATLLRAQAARCTRSRCRLPRRAGRWTPPISVCTNPALNAGAPVITCFRAGRLPEAGQGESCYLPPHCNTPP